MNYLVGLTGGIGSGKSTVATLFATHGVRIIDTDLISHRLTQAGGDAVPALHDAFGAGYIDTRGALDRNRMRELVFGNPAEKKRLEAILHPLILAQVKQQASLPSDAPYTLVVVPLLFESGRYADWLHRIVAVDCTEAQQVSRAMQRGGLSEPAVRAIMAQQLSRSERLGLADEIICNDGSLEDLKRRVFDMHQRLLALAAESD